MFRTFTRVAALAAVLVGAVGAAHASAARQATAAATDASVTAAVAARAGVTSRPPCQVGPRGEVPGGSAPGQVGARSVIAFPQFRWPQGQIPYVIDWSLSNATNLIGRAFQEYHQKTCLRFVQKTAQHRNYIKIFAGQGCYSNVGMVNQGEQPVSLGQGCLPYGTIVHELGHAVGLFHEHNRSDRDDHLIIYWQNIQQGMADQFTKVDPSHNLLINTFDLNSIMLYGSTLYSKDGRSPVMVHRGGQQLREVYDKPGLSRADVERINVAYGCR